MDASPHRRRNIGIALIIFPPACLFGSLILWAIVSFILNSMVMSGNGFGSPEFYRLLNVLFGFLGIIGVLGFFTALPIGLYLTFSKPKTA